MIGVDIGGCNLVSAIVSDEISIFKKPAVMGIGSLFKDLREYLEKDKVVVTTSIPINLLVSRFDEMRTLTLLIPGPGLNYSRYGFILKGYVNHRGDVVEKIDEVEVKKILEREKFQNVAIASKFSVRNPILEEEVKRIVKEKINEKRIALSYFVGGLNYPTRINTTVINAKLKETIWDLSESIKSIIGDFYYLKGDGAISSYQLVVENPSELYGSTAVASAFGAIFLTGEKDAVVVNIGGISTSLVRIENGKPVIVEGVEIAGRKTLIRCVDSISIPLGGNSIVQNGKPTPNCANPIAFGGNTFTLTDALNYIGFEIGESRRSKEFGKSFEAEKVVDNFVSMVADNLKAMECDKIIGAGYLAPYLIPEIAKKAEIDYVVPEHSEAICAIGSAVTKVSLTLHARYDTEKGIAIYNGVPEKCPFRTGSIPKDDDLIETAKKKVLEIAKSFGEKDIGEIKVLDFNSFTVVKGGMKRGVIADLTLQIEPGIKYGRAKRVS
ncbi:MAG: hydantoinase/oxoprolinase family protein [Archaeoglobaceae archaeon]|nr:hydantoinase/oxoprolinase family protein [Archaeoglobaceae archaeon]MDW8118534.1 hydantoinase/oxoprolinase family protein [Archaeoglobaceae archaeon]